MGNRVHLPSRTIRSRSTAFVIGSLGTGLAVALGPMVHSGGSMAPLIALPAAGLSFGMLHVWAKMGRGVWAAGLFGIWVVSSVTPFAFGASAGSAFSAGTAYAIQSAVAALTYQATSSLWPGPIAMGPRVAVASALAACTSSLVAGTMMRLVASVADVSVDLTWMTANLVGLMVFSPAIILWSDNRGVRATAPADLRRGPESPPAVPRRRPSRRSVERIGQPALLSITTLILLLLDGPLPGLALSVPILLWGAVRLGPRFVAFELAAWWFVILRVFADRGELFTGATNVGFAIPDQLRVVFLTWAVITLGLFVLERAVTFRQLQESRLRLARSEAALQAKYSVVSGVIESIPVGVAYWDADERLRFCNEAFGSFMGRSAEDLVGRSIREVTGDEVYEDGSSLIHEALRGRGQSFEVEWSGADIRHVLVQYMPQFDDGRPDGFLAVLTDITSRREAELDALLSADRFRLLAENASGVLLLTDGQGYVQWTSPSAEALLGLRPDCLPGIDLVSLVAPDDRGLVTSLIRRSLAGAVDQAMEWPPLRMKCPDGSTRWFDGSARAELDASGAVHRLAIGLRDVDEHLTARELLADAAAELLQKSQTDDLTGLANRHRLRESLSESLASSRARNTYTGVLYIDLDHFKHVNDALTHVGGDELLKAVADRMKSALRQGDTVARVGGDEFVCVLPGLPRPEDARVPLEHLRAAVSEPLHVSGEVIRVTASAGLAVSDGHETPDALLRDADIALYRAKAAGRNRWAAFDADIGREASQRLHLENEVHAALSLGQIKPWYQPIVDLRSGRIAGYEALARWKHPERDWLESSAFIPVAEQGQLIVEIDRQVTTQAIRVLSTLPEDVSMAVNISASTVAHGELSDWLFEALKENGVKPERISLELTETGILELGPTRGSSQLLDLAEQGFRLVVDDFGTGFSSISHLRDLPISGLKLDHSFTAGLGDGQSDRLAAGLCDLARALELNTVAEGVETVAQVSTLRRLGWKHAQGYLFGCPTETPVREVLLPRTRAGASPVAGTAWPDQIAALGLLTAEA